jgi:hypothetical protein
MITAIETVYKGYRFRSRLESRWAVFFDALGLKWDYEIEGFDLGAAGKYLPDFRIRYPGRIQGEELTFWLEVKPERPVLQDKKHVAFAQAFRSLILVFGVPDARFYCAYSNDGTSEDNDPDIHASFDDTFLLWSSKGRPWWCSSDTDIQVY